MDTISLIEKKVRRLYQTDPRVHVRFCSGAGRASSPFFSAVIRGVYPHVFRLEEKDGECLRLHTLQYKEIFCGQIEIPELNIR